MVKVKPKKLVYGVGINDAGYVTKVWETISYINGKQKQKRVWECPYYRVWSNMLMRCYSDKYQKRQPSYVGCSVSDNWLTFSVFKVWMESQDFEEKHLDKDLLFNGNKIYSAETCVFVAGALNLFIVDKEGGRGEWPVGIYWHKGCGKFLSRCNNPFTKKNEQLGLFTCPQEAHQAWLKRKLELAHLLAAEQTDERVGKALIDRYTNFGSAA